jgi:hypothetical protein
LRRFLAHNPRLRVVGWDEVPGGSNGAPDLPDLRAAVDARHASTSKNIVNRPGPEAKYPSRPESSPFEDQMARDVFGVDQLVPDPPSTEQLRTALAQHRKR